MNPQPTAIFQEILDRLQHLTYGYNYAVTFGTDIFDDCPDIATAKARIQQEYPQSKPGTVDLIQVSTADFWETLNECFDYRGDEGAGLKLNQQQEINLAALQNKYKVLLGEYLADNSTIFVYPDATGIPGYPVFWEYRFVILAENRQCLFVYGSASD